jgi:hypothetical protein
MNKAAQQLGRMARGVPKNFSAEERARLVTPRRGGQSPAERANDMTTKHTPGPWDHDNRLGIIRNGTQPTGLFHIADCADPTAHQIDGTREEREANARLIAAAPEMAKALQAIVAGGITGWSLAKHNAARAALEKAGVPLD